VRPGFGKQNHAQLRSGFEPSHFPAASLVGSQLSLSHFTQLLRELIPAVSGERLEGPYSPAVDT
jgi:hypothetical protein